MLAVCREGKIHDILSFYRDLTESNGSSLGSFHIHEMIQHILSLRRIFLSIPDPFGRPILKRFKRINILRFHKQSYYTLRNSTVEPFHLTPKVAHIRHKIKPTENQSHQSHFIFVICKETKLFAVG